MGSTSSGSTPLSTPHRFRRSTSDPHVGGARLSNFLLWQAAYAELLFVDTLWPDFDGDGLRPPSRVCRPRPALRWLVSEAEAPAAKSDLPVRAAAGVVMIGVAVASIYFGGWPFRISSAWRPR
jgi:hypothetical protein